MKTQCLTRTVVLALLAVLLPTMATAVPIGTHNEGIHYLLRARSLDWLSAGVYGTQIKRDIEYLRTGSRWPLEMERITGYLGADVLHWATVYGIVGSNATKLGSAKSFAGRETIYGAGIRLSLLDHHLREQVLDIDRWRVVAGIEYVKTESRIGTQVWDWREINGSLTLSVVNDVIGNKIFRPESILLYAGPYMSIIESDEMTERTTYGAITGIEIFLTSSASLDVRLLVLDAIGGSVGLNVRF